MQKIRIWEKNPDFVFQARAFKIRFLDFSLNFKDISFSTFFYCTNFRKKCQLISAVCLLFFKNLFDSILKQHFMNKSLQEG